MKKIILLICILLTASTLLLQHATAQPVAESGKKVKKQKEELNKKMGVKVEAFLKTLDSDQKKIAMIDFADLARFDWNYTPRQRKGLPLKNMTAAQRAAGMDLVQLVLSKDGYTKAEQIIDLENVLRVVENRPPNDTYRDPENYAFLVYGSPGADPWGWRVEGHHLSLHFSSVDGLLTYTPSFMGSNPGQVLAEVPQKGRRVLKDEQDLGFELLHALDKAQLSKVMLDTKAPNEMFTTNTRKATLAKFEGLPFGEMTGAQKDIFKKLILTYLERYHVTLKNQQWAQLEKAGLDHIYFAWMGDDQPVIGAGHGHYYRVHGPGFLIEFDNTQNGGNHVHSVVRDLNNDFGEDMLKMHYEKKH